MSFEILYILILANQSSHVALFFSRVFIGSIYPTYLESGGCWLVEVAELNACPTLWIVCSLPVNVFNLLLDASGSQLGISVLPLPHESFGNVWRDFLVTTEWGESQRCCKTSYNVPDNP